MSKKAFARLVRIVTGTFDSAREEISVLDASVTKFEKFVHFWVLVVRSYVRNRCPVRAAALSYTTLLALIPTLALGMSVSSLFLKQQGEDKIGAFIEEFIAYMVPDVAAVTNVPVAELDFYAGPGLPLTGENTSTNGIAGAGTADTASLVDDERVVAAKERAAVQIRQFIENTYSGTLGTVGLVILLSTVILMLVRIEDTFNDIWGVTRGRDWLARVTNYFTAIALGPTLLIAAIGLSSGPRLQQTRGWLDTIPLLEPLISQLVPVVLISVTFAMFYKLMPNTKVHFSAAMAGGALAGLSWHLFNQLSIHLGSSALNASKIYGSLALVPLLMVGLYVVWVIVLFGAQVAYAFQNRESYLQERLADNVNQRGREFVALRLMTCLGQSFQHGLPAPSVADMSRELGIPSKLVSQVLHTLLAARLVDEVHGVAAGYVPARPLETINCHHILLAMRATQGQELVTREEPVREEVFGEFARIQAAEKAVATTVSMLSLVNRAQARLELQPPAPALKPENNRQEPAVELTELPLEPVDATAPELPVEEPELEPKPVSKPASATVADGKRPEPEAEPNFPL